MAPLIAETYSTDADGDRIADRLLGRLQAARATGVAAVTPEQKQAAAALLDQTVHVELVFNRQITQAQIDAFLALGGQIDYVYESVSYGWNGKIPLAAADGVPGAMGPSLVLLEEAQQTELHMQLATQTGRVRPVWASGFAGVAGGIDGDNSITIAIIDTGVDESHTDLNGRRVYWQDFSTDALATPQDVIQHGTHVAGIATGTGSASGAVTGTLFYTSSGDLTGVPQGYFLSSPVDIPPASVTFASSSLWLGGSSATLAQGVRANGSTGNYSGMPGFAYGTSPLATSNTFTALASNHYSDAQMSNGTTTRHFAVVNSITNYQAVGDGRNRFSGVAPGCNWAGAKSFTNTGFGLGSWSSSAVDSLVASRVANNIKVINMSVGTIGDPGLDPTIRQKVNTAVNNGIVLVISAGNDGENGTAPSREIDDPGRAALALTVAAANDINQVTDYTSHGFSSPGSVPGQEEDFKPDIAAPGGSDSYSLIMSVDSNTNDGGTTLLADQQANDYYNAKGTSMAGPFAAGCAALVIDAMQQSGVTWDHASSQHSLFVKMVLNATATETNQPREVAFGFDPTLERATAGPNGFPVGKDQFEGYGMINPDAAVEGVLLTLAPGSTVTATLGGSVTARRAWARTVTLTAGNDFATTLTNPAGGDYDLYLYDDTPGATGSPVILASSTTAGNGGTESISVTPGSSGTGLLVVKRISGAGQFSLISYSAPTAVSIVRADANPTSATSVDFVVTFSVAVSGVDATDFDLTVSGVTGSTVTAVSAGTSSYTVSVNTGSGDGTIRLDVSDDDTINDGGIPLGGAGAGNGDFTSGQAYTIDRTPPAVNSSNRADPNPTNAASVDFIVTFSEPVTGVGTGDFSLTTTGGIAGASVTAVSAGTTSYTVSVNTGSGEGTLRLDVDDDDSIIDAAGNPLGGAGADNGDFTSGQAYTIDRTPPAVNSSNRADPNPTSAASVDFIVTFSKLVTGVGTDDFSLTATGGITGASVTAVSAGTTSYTVTVNTGSGEGTLRLDVDDDDSIIDAAGNPLGGVGAGNGNFTSGQAYIVDKAPPALNSSNRADTNPTSATFVDFVVTFSEPVFGVDASDFELTVSGITGSTVTAVSAGTSSYTVSVNTGSGDGTIRLDVNDDDSIVDALGKPLGGVGAGNGSFTSGQAYTIDRTAPAVNSSNRADPNPTNATLVDFVVTFGEPVIGVDESDFDLTVSGITGSTVTAVSAGTTSYTVTVDTGSGNGTLRLDVDDDDSIIDAVGYALGGPGAGNGNFTSGQAYTIDKTPPVVISSNRAGTDPTSATSVDFIVTFSKPVTGVGTDDFSFISFGITGASVTAVSAGTTSYAVTVNAGSGDGWLRLDVDDDDSIIDAAGNPLGGAGAGNGDFTSGQVYNIDLIAPSVISIALVDPNPTAQASVEYRVRFSEPVAGVDIGDFSLTATGGITGASVTGISGVSNWWTPTVNTGSGNGMLRLDLNDDDSIIDDAGNPLGGVGAGNGNVTTGSAYTVIKSVPVVAGIEMSDDDQANSPSLGFTNSQTVDVQFIGIGGAPVQMWLSESATFTTGAWTAFANPTSFTFATANNEVKTLYAKLNDGFTTVGAAGNVSTTITLDTVQPQVTPSAATPDPNNPWIDVTYSEPVDFGVLVPGNYAITASSPTTVLTVTQRSATEYRLVTTNQGVGDPHLVTVTNVADRAGNLIDPENNTASWLGVPVDVSRFELE